MARGATRGRLVLDDDDSARYRGEILKEDDARPLSEFDESVSGNRGILLSPTEKVSEHDGRYDAKI